MRTVLRVLSFALIPVACWAGRATATTPAPCPANTVQCVQMPASTTPGYGQVDMAAPGTQPGTPWMVTDPNGAPMAWVNLYGFYSAGAPGFPGGLICTTNVLNSAACLTPNTGTVELFDSDGDSPVSLSYADILYLHHLEAAHP